MENLTSSKMWANMSLQDVLLQRSADAEQVLLSLGFTGLTTQEERWLRIPQRFRVHHSEAGHRDQNISKIAGSNEGNKSTNSNHDKIARKNKAVSNSNHDNNYDIKVAVDQLGKHAWSAGREAVRWSITAMDLLTRIAYLMYAYEVPGRFLFSFVEQVTSDIHLVLSLAAADPSHLAGYVSVYVSMKSRFGHQVEAAADPLLCPAVVLAKLFATSTSAKAAVLCDLSCDWGVHEGEEEADDEVKVDKAKDAERLFNVYFAMYKLKSEDERARLNSTAVDEHNVDQCQTEDNKQAAPAAVDATSDVTRPNNAGIDDNETKDDEAEEDFIDKYEERPHMESVLLPLSACDLSCDWGVHEGGDEEEEEETGDISHTSHTIEHLFNTFLARFASPSRKTSTAQIYASRLDSTSNVDVMSINQSMELGHNW